VRRSSQATDGTLEFAFEAPAGVVADDDDGEVVADEHVEFGDVEAEGTVAGDHHDRAPPLGYTDAA